jgi:hypothetical protein
MGQAEVRVVNAGPREVRFYGLREGRRLRSGDFTVRRATVMTASGPRVLVLEPRDDYYVAVTSYDIVPSARFDVEVDVVADPGPPGVVVVNGFAPRRSVEVAFWAPAPVVVAPAPPAVRVRRSVDVHVHAPAPHVRVFAPAPPSVSIGIGVPSPHVVVTGGRHHVHGHGHISIGHGHGHRGHGKGHHRGRGRGHRRHH